MLTDDRLTKAVGMLIFFYAVGTLIQVSTGESVQVLQLPTIEMGDGNNFVINLINGAVVGMQFIIDLLAMPLGVIAQVDMGYQPLTIFVKGVGILMVVYIYLVIIQAVKNILNPLH